MDELCLLNTRNTTPDIEHIIRPYPPLRDGRASPLRSMEEHARLILNLSPRFASAVGQRISLRYYDWITTLIAHMVRQ